MVLTGDLEDGVIVNIIFNYELFFAQLQNYCMIITLSRILYLHGGLGGCLAFLTEDLKDDVIFEILDHLGVGGFTNFLNFTNLTILSKFISFHKFLPL